MQFAERSRSYGDIAKHFGVCESTVYYWKRQGAPIRRGGQHDVEAIDRWYREWLTSCDGVSIQTSNYYLTAIKGFCRWLVKDRRRPDNPLAHLSRLNADADRWRERRTLTPDEFGRFVEAARMGSSFRKLSGPDRAMLYTLAAYTGLRENELASLTAASFDFDSDPPTVTVDAAYSKRRRRDVLPVRTDLAKSVREWLRENRSLLRGSYSDSLDVSAVIPLRENLSGAKLWPGSWPRDGAEMVKRDLAGARIPYRDAAGHVFDFHALRHQFISNLAASGVHPKVA